VLATLCGVEQRVPPIFGSAAITLGIGPHSSILEYFDAYTLFTVETDDFFKCRH